MIMVELKEIYEFPFIAGYDPVLPMDIRDDEKGVLCILFQPSDSVRSVRIDASISAIMDELSVITGNSGHLRFYELGNKMIIMHKERDIQWKDALIYNGQKFTIYNNALICNKNFTSLSNTEAMLILESAKMHIDKARRASISIEVKE